MQTSNVPLQKRLYIAAALVLAVGLGAALMVYRSATHGNVSAAGYVSVGGTAYAVQPDDSKRYLREVEVYGGKAAVLAADVNRWFAGLWQGTQLAVTLAVLTVVVALLLLLLARAHAAPRAPPAKRI
jgi:hypothetical protein